MRNFLFLLALFLLAPALARGGERFPVTTQLEGKDLVTGRVIRIPANRGYKFEIVDGGTLHPSLKVFDSAGLEVQANFPIITKSEKKPPESATDKSLKDGIFSWLKSLSAGAVVEKEGCCDVDEASKKESKIQKDAVEANTSEAKVDGLDAESAPDTSEADAEETPVDEAEDADAPEPEKVEVAKKNYDQALDEIESPPADFVDVSPAAESEETAEQPAIAEPEAKPAKRAEFESTPEFGPIPKSAPRNPTRAPAVEALALPENGPIPKFRPGLLDSASAPLTRGRRKKKEEAPVPEPKPEPKIEQPAEEPEVDSKAEPKEKAKPEKRSYLCRAFDAFRAKGVPEKPLRQAMAFLDKNSKKFVSQQYFSIADYSQSSAKKRFYLLDLKNFSVKQEKVSHGGGRHNSGDPNHDGMLDACGTSGSERTRAGFFQVGDYYFSQHGRFRWPLVNRKPPRNGIRLIGLTPGVNTSVFGDGYVMHEAKYNYGKVMGRSDGCPAFVPGHGSPIFSNLRNGSMQYHYAPMCTAQQSKALAQVPGWQNFCK